MHKESDAILLKNGIASRKGYDAHAEPAYSESIYSWIGKEKNLLPNLSVRVYFNNSIILPLHHKIDDDQIYLISDKIKEGISKNH